MTHWVYVHIDADGEVLYVGCTNNPTVRLQLHGSESPWFDEIADVAVIGPFKKAEALKIESEFIGELQPPHNVYGTDRDPRIRANRARSVDNMPPYFRRRIAGGSGIVHTAHSFGHLSLRSSCGQLQVPNEEALPETTQPTCRLCVDFAARDNKRMGRVA